MVVNDYCIGWVEMMLLCRYTASAAAADDNNVNGDVHQMINNPHPTRSGRVSLRTARLLCRICTARHWCFHLPGIRYLSVVFGLILTYFYTSLKPVT
jgi:hypothetical protein